MFFVMICFLHFTGNYKLNIFYIIWSFISLILTDLESLSIRENSHWTWWRGGCCPMAHIRIRGVLASDKSNAESDKCKAMDGFF